ncbi:MAG: alpha/beta hydrolase [Novosphingobium sp.]|nr:alpha/beta hydrolase [Novosphingobium sp.]
MLDPELAPLIALASDPPTESGRQSPMMAALLAGPQPVSEAVETRQVMISGFGAAPDVRALLYLPRHSEALRGAVLHIHGGGYISGAPEMAAASNLAIAEALGVVVLSVDYRLAPTTKYPGAVDDCHAALGWLHRHSGELTVDPQRIAVSGESAGGGLTAALALMARDQRSYPIAFQHLIYPMIDDRTAIDPDISPFVGQFVWTQASNLLGWTALLDCPPGSDQVSHYAAAARADDLSGLPPTFIACGALDLFVDENIDFARRLIRSGVPTELHVYPGAPHGFQFVKNSGVAQLAARDSLLALGKALAVRAT